LHDARFQLRCSWRSSVRRLQGRLMDAGAAYARKDYATALRLLRPLADQGNAHAQNHLGVMYVHGQGVPQNYVLAHMWANLAAAHGLELASATRDLAAAKMTPAQITEAQRLARKPTVQPTK
jgi:uncharacterized protein